jgi:hypothetical protein
MGSPSSSMGNFLFSGSDRRVIDCMGLADQGDMHKC